MRRHSKASSAGSNLRQAIGLRRHGIAVVSLLSLLVLCGISAPSALADESRPPEPFSPLSGAGSGLTLTSPGGVAVDDATGNVFLNDGQNSPPSSPSVTDFLGATGGAPTGLISPFRLTGFCFEVQNGVAFDNSPTSPNQGTLYVADCGGGKIKKYTRNPLTEKYESAGELTATGGSFNGGTAGLAVDSHGDVFYGEFTCRCVVKFNPAGIQVAFYNLSFPVVRPVFLAVDSAGDLFVARTGLGGAFKFPADGSGEINPSNFTTIVPSGVARVAVDPARNLLYVGLSNPSRVAQYNATTLEEEFEFGAETLGGISGLGVNSATNRVYVSDNGVGKNNVSVFGPPIVVPSATSKAASNVTGTKATLNGIVNPQGNAITECKFEYGPTSSFGSMVPCEGSIPTDSNEHSVSAQIGGLTPNGTIYHFRLVVKSVNGPASPQGTDRTLVTGNTVFTEPATPIGSSSATLNGVVKPEGTPFSDCKFEYGTALDYGDSVSCSPAAGGIADDFDSHALTVALSGLKVNTTYHFRLSATNINGTVLGQDRTFTTYGPPQILEQRPIDATQTAVTLQAKIDPSGSPTTYHFEFGTDTSYGTRIPADHDLFAGTGTEPAIVNADRTGLQERSVYHFRVIATNASGTTPGPDQRIETLNANGLPDNRGFELVTPADKGTAGSVAGDLSQQQTTQAAVDGTAFMYPVTNGFDTSTAGGWLRQRAERTSSGWLSAQLSAPSLVPPPGNEETQKPSQFLFASPKVDCGFIESYNPLTADTPPVSTELGVTNLYRWRAHGDGVEYDLVTDRLPLNPEVVSQIGIYFNPLDASDDCSRALFNSLYRFIPGASGFYEWDEGTLRDAGVLPNGAPGAGAVLGGQVNAGATSRWNAVSPAGSRVFFTATANQGPSTGHPAIFTREEAARGVGSIHASSTLVDGVSVSTGSFAPGQIVSGVGIPEGTRIASFDAGEGKITLTAPATSTHEGASLTSFRLAEVSASHTAVPTNGARFEAASPDSSHVFFRANYGIAGTSSTGPTSGACGPLSNETEVDSNPKLEEEPVADACDLYAYDVTTGVLTDLSADSNTVDAAVGAHIQGAVAVDDDGSNVYFAALGQLVPGKGRTYAENTAGFGSANVYLYRQGQSLAYVTTLAEHGPGPGEGGNRTGDLLGSGPLYGAALMRRATAWVASTDANGDELLFMSSRNLTGWDSGGINKYAAYIWSADTGRLNCVSCRPDGLPSVAASATTFEPAQSSFLLSSAGVTIALVSANHPRSLSADGSRVLFSSPDVLASGAVAGKRNVYEWDRGQVFFLAVADGAGNKGLRGYLGSSDSSSDVFLATGERLAPQDTDSLSDVYDLRVDGGFPSTPEAPRCQVDESVPLVPNQIYCQGTPSPQPGSSSPASAGFQGSGNPPAGESGSPSGTCPKGKVRRHGRCVKRPARKHKAHKSKRAHRRAANNDRGGAR